jgi:hypothetical protein
VAKFLLNWPTTDAILPLGPEVLQSGVGMLEYCSKVALPDSPDTVQTTRAQQWREIEEMLVERRNTDTGTTEYE